MKQLVKDYTFDHTAKTLTLTGFGTVRLDRLVLITNVTRGVIVFNFADSTHGATVATNVVTLLTSTDMSAWSNADKFEIIYDRLTADPYDDPDTKVSVASLPLPTGAATETTLLQLHTDLATTLAALVDGLEGNTDGIETKLDTLHTDLATTLAAYVDGLEGLIGTSNTSLATLHTDIATTLAAFVDGLEALIASSNTKLDTLHTDLTTTLVGYVDGLEALATTLNTYVDGLETLITSTNTKLDSLHTDLGSIDGHVDGLETLVTATNTKLDTIHADLASIDGHVDGLEASASSIDGKLTHGQGVSAASVPVVIASDQSAVAVTVASVPLPSGAATEATLSAIKTDVDKIPSQGQALAAASTPVVLPAAQITALTPPAAITGFALETGGHLASLDTEVAATNTKLDTIHTDLGVVEGKQDTGNTSLAAIKTDVDKIPSQGQALAAASMPVVLPAAQITTLTPPATITGFALEAGGHLASVDTGVTATNTKLDTIHSDLGTIDGHVDGLETLATSTNTKLDTIHTDLGTIDGHVDGLEASATSIDGKLVTARTADYDSGAGTVTTEMQGIALPASGGPVAGGTSTNPLRTDPTGSTTQPVSAASLPLPSGASTEATLLTIDGHVDGLETLVTSTNTKLDTVHTDLVAIDGHVDGLETLVTSTNTKLDTVHTDLVTVEGKQDTGNASLASIDGGTPAALGQTTMSASMPVVVASDQSSLAVAPKKASLQSGTVTGTGTKTAIDVSGYSHVVLTVAGTYNLTSFVQSSMDNSTYTLLNGVSVYADSTWSSTFLLANQTSTIVFDVTDLLWVQINTNGYTSGTLNYALYGVTRGSNVRTFLSQFPTAAAMADTLNNPTVTQIGAAGEVFNGTTWDRVRSGGVTGMQGVSGDTAAAATDAGNPVKIGGIGKTANPSAVTDGQRVNAIYDKLGKQVVVGSIRDMKGDQQTTITSSTAETTIVTAVASTFLDLYGLIITNTSSTVCKVTIRDDTAGTIRFVFQVPALDTRGFMLPESAGLKQAVVNKPWTATCGTSVAGIEIAALFVKNT